MAEEADGVKSMEEIEGNPFRSLETVLDQPVVYIASGSEYIVV